MEDLVSGMNWDRSRVMVTGATGLVGSWLVRRLLELNATVVVLIRDWDPQSGLIRSGAVGRTSVVSGSLEDYASLERAVNEYEVDTVLHLGAQTIVGTALRSPLPTFEANIRGTYNLLEVCRRHPDVVRVVVVASSDKAYGTHRTLPYTEDMALHGSQPYEVSKSCTDLLAQSYAGTYGVPIAIARCGNIYGGGDLNWSRLVPETVRALHEGRRPVLRSNGTLIRDYIYVRDVVRAYLDLAEHMVVVPSQCGEAFNFSGEQPLTVMEMVAAIQRTMGRDDLAPEIRDAAQGEILDQRLSAAKARAVLGWSTHYTLDQGLAETVAWYRSYLTGS